MRKLRELKQGASYHVITRAHRREFILNNPEMKELFLDVVKRAKEKYSFMKHIQRLYPRWGHN